MIRLIFTLLIIALLSLAVTWIADEPGKVMIDWSTYHVETSVLILLAFTACVALFCVLVYSLLSLLFHTPGNWTRLRLAKRQMLGIESITQTFAAIATHDMELAHKKLALARQYLPNQPLPLMLAAQIARLEGDERNAHRYIEQMLGNEVTEFMALSDMVEKAKSGNDIPMAIIHAQKALAIKPQDNWIISSLAALYVKAGRSKDASLLLESSLRNHYINRPFYHRETASLLYEKAKALVEEKRHDSAIAVLEESLRHVPGYVPATSLLAEIHITARNDVKKALKILGNAWKIEPHPSLREVLLKCVETFHNKQKFIPTLWKIAKVNPEHEESKLLVKEIKNVSNTQE